MKVTAFAGKSLVAVVGISFVLGSAALAADQTKQTTVKQRAVHASSAERVVLVHVTGSLIPQRVVLVGGRQVNSASPVTVFQGDELTRNGAVDVAGILAQDPSITFGRRR